MLKDTLDVELINFILSNFNTYFLINKQEFIKLL